MDDYVLCSSSTEEGEISESKTFEPVQNAVFPRGSSILKDWYLPNSQHFIGCNSIPRPTDNPVGLPLTRIKKKLRKDMPSPFNVISLNKDRAFFNNKFELLTEDKLIKDNKIRLSDFKKQVFNDEIKEITTFEHSNMLAKSIYGGMSEIFPFDDKRQEVVKNVEEFPECKKFIFTRDSIVDKLDVPDVFNFFRVIKSRKGVSYVFEDSYFRRLKFYDYLDLYFEEVMKGKNSKEIRTYVYQDTFLAVFSSSVFTKDNYLYRYYDGLDVDKNFIAAVNKENIEVHKRNLMRKENYNLIFNLDLEEGDYAISNGKIYRVGVNGDKHEYEGLVFTDF